MATILNARDTAKFFAQRSRSITPSGTYVADGYGDYWYPLWYVSQAQYLNEAFIYEHYEDLVTNNNLIGTAIGSDGGESTFPISDSPNHPRPKNNHPPST